MGKKQSGYPIDWNHFPKVPGIISHCAKRNLLWTIPTGAVKLSQCHQGIKISQSEEYKLVLKIL